jgi:FkbM family methyltransferase
MPRNDLIFDVGANNGDDTAAYLGRGYNVVAVEANPSLCLDLRARFQHELGLGRLTLAEGAIAECPGETITLYINSADSEWGTTVPSYARQGEALRGTIQTISVPTLTILSLVEQFGVPHYLKIDIEGADILCLRGLVGQPDVPTYVSIERPKSISGQREVLELLRKLGYAKFQIIDQTATSDQAHPLLSFKRGDTGLFGDELPSGDWINYAGTMWRLAEILLRKALFRPGLMQKLPAVSRFAATGKWFDIHAAKS